MKVLAAWVLLAGLAPMTAAETRAFMKSLAQFAVAHHLKTNAASPQRGMMCEYWDHSRPGKPGEFIQGEGLDTMHDGAWFAVAMVNAHRATGDKFYKEPGAAISCRLCLFCRAGSARRWRSWGARWIVKGAG